MSTLGCHGWSAWLRPFHAKLVLLLALNLAAFGCGSNGTKPGPKTSPPPAARPAPGGTYRIDLFKAEPKPGTAVVILIDTSGSMAQTVPDQSGKMRPKHVIAREALERIIDNTAKWKKDHPQANLQMSVYRFSSSEAEILPMGEFDAAKAKASLKKLPSPNSGTAIGRALEAGVKALYRSGCMRKFVICITDGENTSGPPPDWVARHLHAQAGGEVELHFVAFDTAASQFQFLKDVNGHVVEAANGAKLQAELERIYQERILVEKEEPENQ